MSEVQCALNPVSPSPPPAGMMSLYAKLDGLWYYQNSAGEEVALAYQFLDGGSASSTFLAEQILNGGGA